LASFLPAAPVGTSEPARALEATYVADEGGIRKFSVRLHLSGRQDGGSIGLDLAGQAQFQADSGWLTRLEVQGPVLLRLTAQPQGLPPQTFNLSGEARLAVAFEFLQAAAPPGPKSNEP